MLQSFIFVYVFLSRVWELGRKLLDCGVRVSVTLLSCHPRVAAVDTLTSNFSVLTNTWYFHTSKWQEMPGLWWALIKYALDKATCVYISLSCYPLWMSFHVSAGHPLPSSGNFPFVSLTPLLGCLLFSFGLMAVLYIFWIIIFCQFYAEQISFSVFSLLFFSQFDSCIFL